MSAAPTKILASLLRKLRSQHTDLAPPVVTPDPPDEFDPIVHQFIYSMLLWEASTTQARNALKRIREAVVDYNELRVCIADEVSHIIGDKYPLSMERAMRLRTALQEIYQRQHAISLAHLADMGKREARLYLDSLSGCPPFVSARVCLMQGLGHAIPVDERLCALLVQEQVLEPGTPVEQATSWLEHHIKAEEGRDVALLFQAWSDEHGHPPKRDKRPITIQTQPPVTQEPKPEPKSSKGSSKSRTKPEPASKKSKSKPRSGS